MYADFQNLIRSRKEGRGNNVFHFAHCLNFRLILLHLFCGVVMPELIYANLLEELFLDQSPTYQAVSSGKGWRLWKPLIFL